MRVSKKTGRMVACMLVVVLAFTTALMVTATYNAEAASSKTKVIKPSGKKDSTDAKRINNALKKYKVVKLRKGKKYYLKSPIFFKSNRTLIATGATIVAKKDAVGSKLKKADYNNLKNVTIKGGTWKSTSKKGLKGTALRFVHSSNIKLLNMKIQSPSYDGHAIELVACKDVLIDNVKIHPRGVAKKSQEAMVQIDIATNATYPGLKGNKKLSNGATCHNITIQNCTIKGNRALTTGYDYANQGFPNALHTGIAIKNNIIDSKNGEGIFIANTKNAIVQGNNVVSEYKELSSDKAIGIHYLMIAKPVDTSFVCENNMVKGGKYSIRAYSPHSQNGQNLTKVELRNNKCYCKKGAGNAIQAAEKGIDSLISIDNKTYNW